MGLLGWIVVGLIAGTLGRWVIGDERTGCLYTLVIGVLGAILGGALMAAIDERGVDELSFRSVVVASLGACLLLLVLGAIRGRQGGASGR